MRDANAWTDLVREIEESMQVSESDYWTRDREKDMRDAFCAHRDGGVEERHIGPMTIQMIVCYQCGRERVKETQ